MAARMSVDRAAYRDRMIVPGHFVWCGSMARTPEGRCHLFLSVWPTSAGFDGWVTHSRIAYAHADAPEGPYHYEGVVFGGSGAPDAWDRDVVHNPCALFHDGRFYLYYTGNTGDGSFWNHRDRQRVGVAVADDPHGPWTRADHPLVDVSPDGWDDVLTTNPSVCRMPDGRFLMVYKAVGGRRPPPMRGPILHGVAFAPRPDGPFVKRGGPVFAAEGANFPGEDPGVFVCGDRIYALLKDNGRAYCPDEERALVLFESGDGLDWRLADSRPALTRRIVWEDGASPLMHRLERPQVHVEEGVPRRLFLAALPEEGGDVSFNFHVGVTFTPDPAREDRHAAASSNHPIHVD